MDLQSITNEIWSEGYIFPAGASTDSPEQAAIAGQFLSMRMCNPHQKLTGQEVVDKKSRDLTCHVGSVEINVFHIKLILG